MVYLYFKIKKYPRRTISMKTHIGIAIVFVGLVLLFPAPIQLIRHGAGFPHEKLFAQMWLTGLAAMLLGLFIDRHISPPLRK